MVFLRKYGVLLAGTTTIRIPIRKAGSADYATGADWTPATGDVKVSLDSGVQANITNLPTYSNGSWQFVLTATELTAKSVEIRIVDSATKAVDDTGFNVETFGHASAMHLYDTSDGVRLGLTSLPNVIAGSPSGLPVLNANSNVNCNVARVNGVAVTSVNDFKATGFATPLNVTDARDAILTQGNTAWTTAVGFAVAGDAMTLTVGERDALALAIEAEIANDATGQDLRQLIANKIMENLPDLDDLTLTAIATQTRDAILDRVLAGNHVTAGTAGALLQKLNVTGTIANTDNANDFKADVSGLLTTTTYNGSLPANFSLLSIGLDGSVTDQDAGGGTSYTLTQIGDEVASRLATYDAPTKAELDAAQAAIISHGDGAWTTATGFAVAGDLEGLATQASLDDVLIEVQKPVNLIRAIDRFEGADLVAVDSRTPTGGGSWVLNSTSDGTALLYLERYVVLSGWNAMYRHSLTLDKNQWAAMDIEKQAAHIEAYGGGPSIRIGLDESHSINGRYSTSNGGEWMISSHNGVLARTPAILPDRCRLLIVGIENDIYLFVDGVLTLQATEPNYRDPGGVGFRLYTTSQQPLLSRLIFSGFAGGEVSITNHLTFDPDASHLTPEEQAQLLASADMAMDFAGMHSNGVYTPESLANAPTGGGGVGGGLTVDQDAKLTEIHTKTQLITSGGDTTIVTPVGPSGKITLIQGFDFTQSVNGSIAIEEETAGDWPSDVATQTNVIKAIKSTGVGEFTGTGTYVLLGDGRKRVEYDIPKESIPKVPGEYAYYLGLQYTDGIRVFGMGSMKLLKGPSF